jgi:hypothetical protein
MVVRNLRKTVEHYRQELSSTIVADQFNYLKGLPFYQWPDIHDSNSKGLYYFQEPVIDFNHAIGLPQKNGVAMPLFDYEQLLFDTLQSNRHVWIKKATGLGVTEFMLRYMAWLCFNANPQSNNRDYSVAGSQMCIVTGPRIELAITLIDRMKGLFRRNIPTISFNSKETVIELNGVHIEAYPSHHLDAMRGLKDVSFIYLDEADFFPPGQQQDARDVSERYIAKSNPHIVLVSTPNAPEGLFEHIEKEQEQSCLYKRLFLDYTYGLDKIYTVDEIQQAKRSPSFEREYNLKYLGLIGNVFHTKDIEAAIERGKKVTLGNFSSSSYTLKAMGLDPGFGSSNFGVCITELVNGKVNVLRAEEYQRPDFNEMLRITVNLMYKYGINFENRCHVFINGANPEFIRALKDRLGEEIDYDRLIAHLKTSYGRDFSITSLIENMCVIPVNFRNEHKQMLLHAKKVLEIGKDGGLILHPSFTMLIVALRTAVEKGDGSLDKDATSFDDCFDAFRLSLLRYK